MSQSENAILLNNLEMTDLSKTNSLSIPKTINLKIKTTNNYDDSTSTQTMSTSTPSIPASISSSLSSSSSSPSSLSLRYLHDTLLSSPSHSTPNLTFESSTKKNKKSNSVGDLLSDYKAEDKRSASQPPLHTNHNSTFSISTFLRNEIEYIDIAETHNTETVSDNKTKENMNHFNFKNGLNKVISGPHSAEERIYNFFLLFFIMEKLLFFGFWICCDSFLSIITILPTRVLHRIYLKLSYFIKNEWMLLYHNFIKYYLLYYYYTFLYCVMYCAYLIKKVCLFIFFCRKSVSNTDNIGYINEYYFDSHYGFCCKLLCILSCCCMFNRSIYYNKSINKSKRREMKWLHNLKRDTYNKRIDFYKDNGCGYVYSGRDYLDIIRLLTLILCVYILNQLNLSQIYHYIRAQENFKLYVLFKIIVIIEHLLSSFGEDCVEALFNSLNINKWDSICINLLFYLFYNIIHSLLLYGHLITLNAAMNSPNNTLITILVADNFYELKSTVFKKYYIQNVFQMACSDIVERFTIFLFVTLILLQNLCYLGWDNFDAEQWFIDALKLFLIMIGFEMVVDTLKHGFICKFNNLSIKMYKSFYIRLSMDFKNARRMNEGNSPFFMDRRLGFSSLPLVTLFIRIMWQLSEYNNHHLYVKSTFIAILFIILYIIKLLLSLIMIIIIAKISNKINKKDLTEMAKKLSNVRRYALIVKKIPV